MEPTRKKRRKKKIRRPITEKDRFEGDQPRDEYSWLNSVNRAGPGNKSGIPAGLRGMSANPEETLAWVLENCKFARRLRDDTSAIQGGVVSPP